MKKVLSIVVIIFSILMTFGSTSYVYAGLTDPGDNPDAYKPQSQSDIDSKAKKYAGKVWGTLQNIGVVVSVAMMTVIGFRYIMGSAEEKAEYKQTMIPFVIGAILLLSVNIVLKVIYSVMS